MKKIHIIELVFLVFSTSVLTYCKTLEPKTSTLSEAEILAYSNQIILKNLSHRYDSLNKYVKYVYPWLVYRPTLPPKFTHEERFEIMLPKYSKIPVMVKLPDDKRDIYDYYPHKSIETIFNDTLNVIVCSPLLPTNEKDIYIMQSYDFVMDGYHKEDPSRIAAVNIYKYKVTKKGIEELEPLGIMMDLSIWSILIGK
jgi:hypothetical protein